MTAQAPPSTFAGKTVLVTGAANGIGRAIADRLIQSSATAILIDRDEIDLARYDSEAQSRSCTEKLDLRDTAALTGLVDRVRDRFGKLDAVVHAAGVIVRRDALEDVTEADFDFQYEVNLRATFFLVERLRKVMAENSSIVLLTSQGWWSGGYGGSLPYAATKAGVVALVRGFSRQLAPSIRVNAVAPGFVDTAMMRDGLTEAKRTELLAQVPLGRLADPLEVADVSLFLASDASRYMTGSIMNVTGGQLIY